MPRSLANGSLIGVHETSLDEEDVESTLCTDSPAGDLGNANRFWEGILIPFLLTVLEVLGEKTKRGFFLTRFSILSAKALLKSPLPSDRLWYVGGIEKGSIQR